MGFQKQDIERAINQNRLLFMWDTGTGKTYALCSIIELLKYYGETAKAIVLTSSIGVLNLGKEFKKLLPDTYNSDRTLVIKSVTHLKNRFIFDNDDYDIIICHYDCFRSICDAYDKREHKRTKKVKYRKTSVPLDKWYGDKKGLVLMDECHLIGSATSQRTKVLFMNAQFWEYRYFFSATPLDKKQKMYALLRLLNKKLVLDMGEEDWLSTFCQLGVNVGGRYLPHAPNMATWDNKKWLKLQDVLFDSYAVKRTKDILNLPPAIDVDLFRVDMSEKHRKIYETFSSIVAEYTKLKNDKEHEGLVKTFYAQFSVMMMCIENPEMLKSSRTVKSMYELGVNQTLLAQFETYINDFNYAKDFAKLEMLDAIIKDECEESENKIIVFFFHPLTGKLLKEIYPNESFLTSDMPDEKRFPVIENFRTSKNKVLFASINIANTSFTLTECKAAVYFERTWSYIDYDQSRGRIHRYGQTEEVRYYNMCYEDSFDYLQLKALETKGACVESLIKKNMFNSKEWKTLFGGSVEEMDEFLEHL